jgi:hypothetical protein
MNTFVLTPETEGVPVQSLLRQAGSGGVEIRDPDGKVLGYLLAANNPESSAYVEASRELDQHEEEIREASQRRGGVSTAELLRRADEAAQQGGGT